MTSAALTRRELALRTGAPVRGRGARVVLAIAVLALAAAAAYANETVRSVEAWITWFVFENWFGFDVYPWRDQIIFPLGTDRFDALALRITVECTSLVVLVPLVVFAAGILVATRVQIGRWILSVLVASVIVFTVNIVRIGVIAYALREIGRDAYMWSHTVVGTVIVAIGTVLAVVTMLLIQNRLRRRRR